MAYPNTIDTMQSVNSIQTLAQAGHSDRHNELATTVNAIQTELGTNPSGAAATVVSRLDTLDTTVSAKAPSASPTFTGVQTNAVGSVSAPSITFTGNTNTGIYRPSTNTVAIATNGVLALSVAAGGDTSIAGALTVTGTVSASGLNGTLLSVATPQALGTAAAGTSNIPARQDHVHSGTNVTLTTPTINSATVSSPSITGGSASRIVLTAPQETWNVSATAATGTVNIDTDTATVWYYTTNASGNWTLNFRGASGTTLSSRLAVGASISVTFMATNGVTPYYANAFQIDGSAVTPKWQFGSAPTAGNASSIDVYTFTIVKTAATPTYTVFASMVKHA